MYTSTLVSAIILAGQVLNVAALPATTITLHSTITSTTVVPATTDAAGFSDAASEQATKTTVTVTETQGIPYPVLITVTEFYCPHSTADVASSTSAVSSDKTSAIVSSTAAPASSSTKPSSETKSSPTPATTTKACVFPIPG
ncbi:unnamed protein product [Aureobasidium mustum]|uniref:Uncharacterized protein n=1 Tax=Aureobasidium mustum TaxID=2773714 RepID=A0A9N8PFJ9_9PEZI|nr:unnamed protein product [Aureobasidium mustum]